MKLKNFHFCKAQNFQIKNPNFFQGTEKYNNLYFYVNLLKTMESLDFSRSRLNFNACFSRKASGKK